MIIVNATALDKSGALSILKQFIYNIPTDDTKWLIFISDSIDITTSNVNVSLVPIQGVKSMHKRLWWDAFGLNKWLKNHNITPIATISLQNTGFRVSQKNIPQFIYYHQSIPFYPYKWKVFKKEHRTLWFYKYIYPFFVRFFLTKKTEIFVQLEFIKRGFVKKFRHNPNLVKVYSPTTQKVVFNRQMFEIDSKKINFFYPATDYFYKNHRVIIEGLEISNVDAMLYLTSYCINNNKIKCLGSIPFEKVCEMYFTCDCLLFPSYIETYGLPLIEAASSGMPIIAADLPYAREVLDGYEGVIFVPYNNPQAWSNAIKGIVKGKRYLPYDISGRPGWKELFDNIKSSL